MTLTTTWQAWAKKPVRNNKQFGKNNNMNNISPSGDKYYLTPFYQILQVSSISLGAQDCV